MSDLLSAGSFEAGGVAVTISTDREALASRIRETFRDLAISAAGPAAVTFDVRHRGVDPPAHPWVVWRDGQRRETVGDDYVVAYLLWEMSQLVFERTGDRLHLHAAAVAMDGKALVLAGRSRAGKSTLAAWLTHRGWGFLTDEVALVDPLSLQVLPFWRPIGVRSPGPLDPILGIVVPRRQPPRESLVPASTLGRLASTAALASLVFPERSSAERAAVAALTPGEALVELTQHFPGMIGKGRDGFRRLARIVEAVPAYALRFHDLDDAESALRGVVSVNG